MFDKKCQFCRYYNNGICEGNCFDIDVYGSYVDRDKVVEDGILDGVVSEIAESINYERLMRFIESRLLDAKVSKKKTKAITEEIMGYIDKDITRQIKEDFNNGIERMLHNNTIDISFDLVVKDSDGFSCSKWV